MLWLVVSIISSSVSLSSGPFSFLAFFISINFCLAFMIETYGAEAQMNQVP